MKYMDTVTTYDASPVGRWKPQWQQRGQVVNGNKNVKENTEKKSLEVIDRLDYRPKCGSTTFG